MHTRAKFALAILGILIGVFGYSIFTNYQLKHGDKSERGFPSPGETYQRPLTTEAFYVMFEGGTEAPFSSPLLDEHRKGTFVSADTGLPLFRSEDKYDSGTGWPSFVKPIDGSVKLKNDDSLLLGRTEVVSADTGAHLGHVFDDGPSDRGGKRYCMNGVALRFIPDQPQ
jgi:peptide-methionine (R)-S-oxide reductase